MALRDSLNTLNGRIAQLVFYPAAHRLVYITDGDEVAIVPCCYREMAERVARVEGMKLTVSSSQLVPFVLD